MPVLRFSGAIAALKNSASRASKSVLKAATSPWVPPKAAAAATPTTAATARSEAPMDATKQKNTKREYHFSIASPSLSSRIQIASQTKQKREHHRHGHPQNHRRICTVPSSWHTTKSNPFSQQLTPPQQVLRLRSNNNNTTNTTIHNHQTVHKRWHGGPHVDHDHADSIHLTFVDGDGNPVIDHCDAYVGESVLQVAQRNDIELEGACEGVCACSTCHVIIPDWDTYDEILEEASEDEEDMLDMAWGLTETSRLGCQIIITKDMDGVEIEIPQATRNFYVDGHVPQPH